MISLWELFIDYVAGSFFLAVIIIAFIIMLIMAIGGLSAYSVIMYLMLFFYAMALGYGYALVTVPLAMVMISYFVYEILKFIDRGP